MAEATSGNFEMKWRGGYAKSVQGRCLAGFWRGPMRQFEELWFLISCACAAWGIRNERFHVPWWSLVIPCVLLFAFKNHPWHLHVPAHRKTKLKITETSTEDSMKGGLGRHLMTHAWTCCVSTCWIILTHWPTDNSEWHWDLGPVRATRIEALLCLKQGQHVLRSAQEHSNTFDLASAIRLPLHVLLRLTPLFHIVPHRKADGINTWARPASAAKPWWVKPVAKAENSAEFLWPLRLGPWQATEDVKNNLKCGHCHFVSRVVLAKHPMTSCN